MIMKIKYLSLAFAAVVLASCSSDELPITNGAQPYELPTDGSEVFVTVADSEDSNTMRAGYAVQTSPTFAQKIVFEKDDAFKMYCKNIWMPQVYKFKQEAIVNGVNGDVFEWADASSKYNSEDTEFADREYGVFPAKMFKFDNENREHLVFSLPKENLYNGSTSASTTQEGRTLYHALVPMFGYNVENSVTFHYMTSLVRVHVLGLPAGSHTLKLESDDLGSSNYYQLSGDFEATVGAGDWDAAAVTNGKYTTAEGEGIQLPEFKTKTTTNAEEREVSIRFETTSSSDYYMYLPFPTGTYQDDKLTLTLDGDPITTDKIEYFAAAKDNEDGTHTFKGGCMIKVELENPEAKTVNDMVGLNNLIAEYADFGRDVTINVTVADDANIEVLTGSSYIDKAKKLIIPQLKNNVTLNILRTKDGTLQENEGNIVLGPGAEKLDIVDAGDAGTGVLTICMASKDNIGGDDKVNYVDAPIEINTKQSVVLKGSFKRAINVKTVKDIYFGDKEDATVDDAFEGAVTVVATGVVALNGAYTGAASVETAGDISLAGTYEEAVTAKTTANVELSGSAKKGITAEAANFTVAEGEERILNAASNVTATTAIVINGQIKHRFNAKGAATVTVAAGASIQGQPLVVYGSGAVNIEGNASKFIMANGSTGDVNITGTANSSITIQDGAKGKLTLDHADNTFAEVNVNGDATIDLKAGKVTTIAVAAEKTATITTAGASVIGEVTLAGTDENKAKANINATWDEKTSPAPALGNGGKAIYTAAQLAKLQDISTAEDVTLYANVKITDESATWTPSPIYAAANENTFDGNGKKISGLKIKATANKATGFFSKIDGATVKNLTLENMNVTATVAIQKVGALAGEIVNKTTIEGVAITGLTMAPTGTNNFFRVGGLAGHATPASLKDITIKNSTVAATSIKGSHFVGGLIGSVSGNGKVTISEDNQSTMVTIDELAATKDLGKDYRATFGMLIGSVTAPAVEVSITKTAAGKFYDANKITDNGTAFYYDKRTYTYSGVTFKFIGMENNYIGFSTGYNFESDPTKNTSTTKVTIGTKTYNWGELNNYKAVVE